MIRLGPLTIARTSTINAYQHLATATWGLHQAVWFAQDTAGVSGWPTIIAADALVSDALSRIPQPDELNEKLAREDEAEFMREMQAAESANETH